MSILLALPPKASHSSGYNVFPVGIAYVSAMMKKNGLEVHTANLEFSRKDWHQALQDLITGKDIDCICTSGLSRDYHKIKEVIDCAKTIRPTITTVIGGGIISSDPETSMKALGADYGVIGQGEITMTELARFLENGIGDLASIKGTIYRTGFNQYTITPSRPDIENIDTIPFPDYEGFNYQDYLKSINYSAAYIIASRSCPFRCTFCFHPSGSRYRQRSLDNLFLEIDYLVCRYPLKKIVISDELFATSQQRVLDFCDRIRQYNLKWDVQLRVNDVNRELLSAMKEAGCNQISYGVESADDTILRSMKKKTTIKQIDKALRLTRKARIEIQGGLIFGDIAETKFTAEKSLKWYEQNPYYGLELNMINVFPGTELYNYAIQNSIIKNKIQYLMDSCPLINLTSMSDEEYRTLSSLIYQKNITHKLHPAKINLEKTVDRPDRAVIFKLTCDICRHTFTVFSNDLLHITKTKCPQCHQRYFIEPFDFLEIDLTAINAIFPVAPGTNIALWGAGEICIKLLKYCEVFAKRNFVVVDVSKSRQSCMVSDKKVYPIQIIDSMNIQSVVIAVIKRLDEIIQMIIKKGYTSIKTLYLPQAIIKNGKPFLTFNKIKRNEQGTFAL